MSAFLHLECLLAWRRIGESLHVAGLYGLILLFFVLSEPPGLPAVPEKAGLLWVGALLALSFVQYRLLQQEHQEGFLEQWEFLGLRAEWLMLAKLGISMLTLGGPIWCLTPLFSLMLGLPLSLLGTLMLLLALGMMGLTLLGGMAGAASLGLRRGEIVATLLVLPLALPILILGSLGSTKPFGSSESLFLLGYVMFLVPLSAFVSATLVRWGRE